MTPTRVPFYLDFVSPYAWLALAVAEAFAQRHSVRFEPRPVVYGVLLDAHGLVGPAESPAKREYTFHDVSRCADLAGLRFSGPPEHPFRSLEALRTVCLFADDPRALELSVALADACWGQGRSLSDLAVIGDVVESVGLSAKDLNRRVAGEAAKRSLREFTRQAIDVGVFGVPTFVYGEELFWGHDRMPSLADRLAGRPGPSKDRAREALSRPRAIDRKRQRP